MPGPVNMIDSSGKAHAVPEEKIAAAIGAGFRFEGTEEAAGRISREADAERYGGIGGKLTALSAGALRGVTLGASDAALVGVFGDQGRRDLAALEAVNPGTSLAGQFAGALAPVVLSGGASAGAQAGIGAKILGATPAALVMRGGAGVRELGAGAGIAGRVAAGAAAGAAEGAAFGAGHYLSQIALQDKPLSAEAFVGSMGHGALFGGAIGGGFTLAEGALLRAKSLFPQREVTREAAEKLEAEATSTIRTTLGDGEAMQATAQQQLREMRLADAQVKSAANKEVAAAKVAEAQARLERQQILTERAKAGPQRRRKVFDEPAEGAAPAAGEPVAPAATKTTEVPSFATEAPRPPTLLEQLNATKTALDEGQSLGALSARRGTVAVDDAANEAIAASNPAAAKLVDAAKRERMSREEIQAWIKGRRAEGDRNAAERGYRVSYERTFDNKRGPAGLPAKMDRVTTYGTETEASLASQARTIAKVAPEERMAADEAAARMFGRKRVAEEIVEGPKPPADLDDAISGALRKHTGEHMDMSDDIARAAKAIGDHEQASADLAEALGGSAPAGAAERAAAYRTATAAKAEADAAGAATAADQLANKLAPEVARKTGKAVDGGLLSKLGDLGAGLEVLGALGVKVFDVSSIPVIGPVLSMYLKARAAMGVVRRAGGSVPRTAESSIAAKAAETRNRVNAAVTKMLDTGAAGARTAAKVAGPASMLATKLFPGPGDKQSKEPDDGDARAAYRRRMDELARAKQPGAVLEAVRDRVHTSDPVLQHEIASAVERKLGFLDSKAPRELVLPTLLKGDGEWHPSKVQLEQFGRYMKAAEDPASVLEDVASGKAVSIEAAETLRKVYPSLYHEAQTMLLERAQAMESKLPYARRVALSILFQVPVDGTMSPNHIAFLQQGKTAAQPPVQGSPAGAPPTPGISGPVALGERAMTSLDRRSGA